MSYLIDGIDFHNLEAMKYYAPPASWTEEKRKEVARERIFSNDWYGARKMDGALYRFCKYDDGTMELLSRSKGVSGDYANKIEWVPHLYDFFSCLPKGTCLLGEIYFPNNEGSRNVTTIMGCLKEKAIARQNKNEKLHYYVFDVLAWGGESIYKKPIKERLKYLEAMATEDMFIPGSEDCIEYAKYFAGEELWNMIKDILSIGGEGVVITRKDALYQPGKRPSKDTLKIKKELSDTIDCFFTGKITPPTKEYTGKEVENWEYWENKNDGSLVKGKLYGSEDMIPVTKSYFNGWAGSLEIGVFKDGEIVSIGYLSGLSDELKSNYKLYSMRPIEVTAMELSYDIDGNLALRHGKFLQFRYDLELKDCDWNKIKREG